MIKKFRKFKHIASGEIVKAKTSGNMAFVAPSINFMLSTIALFKNRNELSCNLAFLASMIENPKKKHIKVMSISKFNAQFKSI